MKPRVAKAVNAMAELGISRGEALEALKRLYDLYDKNWEFIEAEDYRALVDAIFEDKETKGTTDNGESCMVNVKNSGHLETGTIQSASKKLCLNLEGDSVPGRVSKNDQPISRVVEKQPQLINLEDESVRFGSSSGRKNDHNLAGTSSNFARTRKLNTKINGRHCTVDIASSEAGDVKLCLMHDKATVQTNGFSPNIESLMQDVEVKYLRSQHNGGPGSSLVKLLGGLCESFSELCKGSQNGGAGTSAFHNVTGQDGTLTTSSHTLESARNNGNGRKPLYRFIDDISKGNEKVKISLVDEIGKGDIPMFFYIPQNIVYQNAHVSVSLARISDEDSCPACSGDCLLSEVPCACARETSGEFAYTVNGLLKEDFLDACISLKRDPPQKNQYHCSQDCPLERVKNENTPDPCKGHLLRRFIKECWSKCGCNMKCGNRVVQRGIVSQLQVFWTAEGKGWGLRCMEDLPKGAFVCEYVGEIMTNMELYERNLQNGNKRHTYPVCLDADWGSESILKDEEALCLDATVHGNVARFINHRCHDANLLDIPVEVETLDRHYYHLAFFTTRNVQALEELTWDYEIDFKDKNHPIKAFQCRCGSSSCRGINRKSKGKRKVCS